MGQHYRVSITENLVTKEPESSSSPPPPPQSPQQQSQPSPPPPVQSPQVPITENLATKEQKSSSPPPPESPQQQTQSPQAPITDDLITKEQESSSSPPLPQSPQQQSQSPPPPQQSPQKQPQSPPQPQSPRQQSQSPPPRLQSPRKQSQSLSPPPQSPQKQSQSPQQQPQSDNHRDAASEMGRIPDDVDFEIDFDFGDMGASMHDEQEEDRPVRKINRRDSTPVQSRARASVHDDDNDRPIETTHQMATPVRNEDKDAIETTAAAAAATSDEPDMNQHEIVEKVIERLADQKVLLFNPDAIGSVEVIKDKLHEALLETTVKITQQKAVAQFKLVDQVLEMIQTAVANVT